jgi:hypothetical protein
MRYGVWFVRVGEKGPDGVPIRFPFSAAEAPPFGPAYYEKVAEVESPSLGYVFFLTNSIDHPWWENEGVTLAPGLRGARSMSVGDVAVEPDGLAWVVDGCGWKPVAKWSREAA